MNKGSSALLLIFIEIFSGGCIRASAQTMGTVAGPNSVGSSVGVTAQVRASICYSDPVRQSFVGTITTTAGSGGFLGPIGYQWVYSDGTTGPSGSANLKPGQTTNLRAEWDGHNSGWAAVRLTWKIFTGSGQRLNKSLVSNQASFSCAGQSAPTSNAPSSNGAPAGGAGRSRTRYNNRIMTVAPPNAQQSSPPPNSFNAIPGAANSSPNPATAGASVPNSANAGTTQAQPLQFRPSPQPREAPPSMYKGPAGPASGTVNGIRFTIKIRAGACANQNPRPQYFVGTLYISGNGPLNSVPITYVWKRSDGAVNNPPLSANLTSAHQFSLRDEWTSAPASGWELVQVTSVNGQAVDIESSQANFSCPAANAPRR